MNEHELWVRFFVSLAIGVLVGMQRQRQEELIAGIRTFALAALLGTVCGALQDGLAVLGGFVAVAITMAIGNYLDRAKQEGVSGVTTEIALLLVFALGVWIARGPLVPAVVVGATSFVLLSAKATLHGWTRRLSDEDWKIIGRFVLVSCVILPVLPDQTYGPFEVFNPRETWLMVVLIVGLGIAGFVTERILGERAGVIAAAWCRALPPPSLLRRQRGNAATATTGRH